ncbi:hypothetical protein J4E83_002520 [Alternaria metachromatica]|uniref:uncharacterized protein n=1 Tax=Alternaria metachromatica TaxID=283354 RepID=UPI0020C2D8FD|nr:uncharacterized protein J4E83_002520 [Alternaria metachromatica]KAI4630994.1 hypothetical protein J4E83_002520 [Alternaria metachromatica]
MPVRSPITGAQSNKNKSKYNSRKPSSGNSKPRSASTTKQRELIDLTGDADMESVDGGVPESVDGGVALSTVSVDGGVPLTPAEAAAEMSSPGSSRAAMQSRASHTVPSETPLQSRADKGKAKATELASAARLPTPNPESNEETHFGDVQSEVHATDEDVNRFIRQGETRPDREDEVAYLTKWKIPQRYRPEDKPLLYAGWNFGDLPLNFLKYLSYELSQGRLLEGDWAPLAKAFKLFYPDMLPGPQLRARMQREQAEQAAQATQSAQPTQSTQTPHEHAGPSQQRGSRAERNAERNARLREAFSLDTKSFSFKEHSPWPHKRIDQLQDGERKRLVRMWGNGSLRRRLDPEDFSWCTDAMRHFNLII